MTRKRYALVGTGSRARMYLKALTETHADVGELVALCDTNPVRLAYHSEQLQPATVATYPAADFEKMLDEQRPDCVIVTSIDVTHSDYICAALDRGLDVITEKPMTTTAERIGKIVDSVEKSSGTLTVTFNYRYSPRNSMVRKLIADGEIGTVTAVHFEWLLNTSHGADYFRRWHREKKNSGGLLVHKSTHHFDLANWWLGRSPESVYARGGLRYYGDENAAARGLEPRPALSRDTDPATDPFHFDLAANETNRRLYLEAEQADGYHRDQDVFAPGITIEDNLSLLVGYAGGANLSYNLTAHAPWEGYRVGFTGTAGRLEIEVVESSWVRPATTNVDPTANDDGEHADVRPKGARILLQKHWQQATEVEVQTSSGGHGGGDVILLDDLFREPREDALGRKAGYLDGIRSVLVGVAGNQSLETGLPVRLADHGFPLEEGPA
ncbi:Gfo/Idh/MocA family oxidoreductase [Microlunatus speluncae]|uniref:Gfo/Idh/MocA family oxidoreductase n=1 Tax=Microlunatus speluncae TaxID=2594267 RepID=UPI00126659EE|nr:Gfo/Idh/MocA family oxidoreductase [Microlunatus speluncae]